MKTITKIEPLALAKIESVILGATYLIASVAANIVTLISPDAAASFGIPPGIMGIFAATISGVLLGFVGGFIMAWVYNIAVPKVGGVKIELK